MGGTKVAAGVVDEAGTLLAVASRETPAGDAKGTLEVIFEALREVMASHEVGAIGVGAAGFVDASRSVVIFAPNLAWREEPLRQVIEETMGLPAVVENDANAAAWAEARFGAGRGSANVVVVTVGTGIGGGIVVDGRLLRGGFGFAGEIGHLTLVPDGRRCRCGLQGCWEQYASGSSLVEEARQRAAISPVAAAALLELGGGHPEGITGPMVTEAARSGDQVALECFEEVGRWLGRGLAQLAAVLDPEVFVLGGGVAETADLLLRPTKRAFARGLTAGGYRQAAEIRLAALGPEAGIVGAADLARHP